MSAKEPEPGFAGRWSRLKQEARTEKPEEAPSIEAEAPAPQDDTRSDAEILQELGLPDPDDLKPGDDIKGFLADVVPTRLRNRALRKLWLSNPVLSNLDELVEYGEDYTDAATVIENLQTAYQVGRGWAGKIIETPEPMARDAPDEPEAEAAGTEVAGAEVAGAEVAGAEVAGAEVAGAEGGTGAHQDEIEPASPGPGERETQGTEAAVPHRVAAAELPQPISRKRMRFRIAED